MQHLEVVLVLLISIILLVDIIYSVKKYKSRTSFKKYLDTIGNPIVPFACNGYRVFMLIDTGASSSHITEDAIKALNAKKLDKHINSVGFGGMSEKSDIYSITLGYKHKNYPVEVCASKALKQGLYSIYINYGVTVHGVLGGDFLDKYNFVIDYKNCTLYRK